MYGLVYIDFRAMLKLAEFSNPKEPVILRIEDSLTDKVYSLLFCQCLSYVPLSTNADRFTSIVLLA